MPSETSSLIPVAKGLYIGPHSALEQAPAAGVTHALSVVNYDITPPEGLCHWAVDLADDEAADLLHALPGAVGWLERAMRQAGSRVLVHCHAGTSRSPAVVVAAIMKAKGLAAPEALAVLHARAPGASPNPGFMAQLELWGEMGCDLDEDHPGYKQFMLSQAASRYEEQGWYDPEAMAALPEDEETLSKLVRYRCRKCRQLVATQRNVVPQEGAGRRAFRRRQQQPQQQQQQQQQQPPPPEAAADPAAGATEGGGSTEQGALFLEPLQWMGDQVVGPTQGKLYCPHCTARLGSFNWAGISSSAGVWVTPAFQVHLSKLDVVSPKLPAALARMRFPAALAERCQQSQPQPQQEQEQKQQELLAGAPDAGGAELVVGAAQPAAADLFADLELSS